MHAGAASAESNAIDPKQSLAEEFWCIAARALPRLKIRFPRSKKVKKIDPSIFASLRHA
jgi:hypothetical protein